VARAACGAAAFVAAPPMYRDSHSNCSLDPTESRTQLCKAGLVLCRGLRTPAMKAEVSRPISLQYRFQQRPLTRTAAIRGKGGSAICAACAVFFPSRQHRTVANLRTPVLLFDSSVHWSQLTRAINSQILVGLFGWSVDSRARSEPGALSDLRVTAFLRTCAAAR
jgi:hypothetical protein